MPLKCNKCLKEAKEITDEAIEDLRLIHAEPFVQFNEEKRYAYSFAMTQLEHLKDEFDIRTAQLKRGRYKKKRLK